MGNAASSQNNGLCADSKAGTLSVTGSATVTETPDAAKVNLEISVTKPTAADARDEAAATAEAVMAAVGRVEGINSDSDIKTSDILLQPDYVWVPESSTNRINGYTFTEQLTVSIHNLTSDTLGAVVDTAVKAGGNDLQVSSIQIDLSPSRRQAAMAHARKAAVRDAAATAQLLAEAAGVTLGPIKSLTDGAHMPPAPIYAASAGMAVAKAAVATPVAVGTADVTATVAAEYAVFNA